MNVDLREAVFRHLRAVRFYVDLPEVVARLVAATGTENIGKITCRDDRSFNTEARYVEDVSGMGVIPYAIYGGVMRFSGYCPEMPDRVLGFKSSPNVFHAETSVEAIRAGIVFRKNRLLKAGGHGMTCGWAGALELGHWQHTRLVVDGALSLRERSRRERWVPDGTLPFEIFPAFHHHCGTDATQQHSYAIDPEHDLVGKYSMDRVMRMSDMDFLEAEAPIILAQVLRQVL